MSKEELNNKRINAIDAEIAKLDINNWMDSFRIYRLKGEKRVREQLLKKIYLSQTLSSDDCALYRTFMYGLFISETPGSSKQLDEEEHLNEQIFISLSGGDGTLYSPEELKLLKDTYFAHKDMIEKAQAPLVTNKPRAAKPSSQNKLMEFLQSLLNKEPKHLHH